MLHRHRGKVHRPRLRPAAIPIAAPVRRGSRLGHAGAELSAKTHRVKLLHGRVALELRYARNRVNRGEGDRIGGGPKTFETLLQSEGELKRYGVRGMMVGAVEGR